VLLRVPEDTVMAKRRFRCTLAVLILVLVCLWMIPYTRYWLMGIVSRERFYQGLPAGYWIHELVAEDSSLTPQRFTELVRSVLRSSPPPSCEDCWSPKKPCPVAVAVLLEMVKDGNPKLRARAIFALRYENERPVEAVPLLLAATRDSEPRVRREAGRTLAQFHDWGREEAIAFISLLNDSDPDVQQQAGRAVHDMREFNRHKLARTLSARKNIPPFTVALQTTLSGIEADAAIEGGTKLAELRGLLGPAEPQKWCENILTVTGPPSAIREFTERAEGKPPEYQHGKARLLAINLAENLSFHALFPVPCDVLAGGYETDGWKWELAHWGCPGGASNSHLEWLEPGKAKYVFRTAWGPAYPFLAKIAKDFRSLRFEIDWVTPDFGFNGRRYWQGGVSGNSSVSWSVDSLHRFTKQQ
jgi:hypothetical protein